MEFWSFLPDRLVDVNEPDRKYVDKNVLDQL